MFKVFWAGKILDHTRDLALTDNSVDIGVESLQKKPRGSIYLDDDVQPLDLCAYT